MLIFSSVFFSAVLMKGRVKKYVLSWSEGFTSVFILFLFSLYFSSFDSYIKNFATKSMSSRFQLVRDVYAIVQFHNLSSSRGY